MAFERPLAGASRSDSRRAALLLEVIVALTIMVAAIGLLAGQLSSGLQMTVYSEQQVRGSQLSDRILALLELDPATIQQVLADGDTDGDFGDQFPGWFWRITVEPTDVQGLGQVTVEILNQEDPQKPDDMDGARVVRKLHLLKADPGRVDLVRDFGVPEEQIASLMENVPIPGFDPTNLDPQALVAMDPQELLTLLPMLLPMLQQFIGGSGGKGIPGLGELLGGLQGGGEGGGDMSQQFLRNFIRQQLGDRISEQDLDDAFNGGGTGDDGGPDEPPSDGRMTRDQMRSMLEGALGNQISPAEMEQLLDAYESGQANNNDGATPPPPRNQPGGNRAGAGGPRNGGEQPTNIRQINNRRGGGKRGG